MCCCCRYQWASPGLGRPPRHRSKRIHMAVGEVARGTPQGRRGELAFSGCTLDGLARGHFAVGCPVCRRVLASTRWVPGTSPSWECLQSRPMNPWVGGTHCIISFLFRLLLQSFTQFESRPQISVFRVLQNRRPSGALPSARQKCLSGWTTASNKDFCLGRRLRLVLSSSFGVLHIFQMSYKEKLHKV